MLNPPGLSGEPIASCCSVNSRLYKRVAAAFPVATTRWLIQEDKSKCYGSCSRHIETHPSHEAMDDGILSGIKKACGNEAIGETVAPLDRHTIVL